MIIKKIQALFHPEQYHGWGKTKRYFEGWYYKIVNAAENKAFALIPGIAMDENGVKHAFIQILDGKKLTSEYHKFDAIKFLPSSGKFEIRIGNNYFSRETVVIDLPSLEGELKFKNQIAWPSRW